MSSTYRLIITNHARERWVERVINPDRYAHLSACKGCETCVSLVNDINCVLRAVYHEINKSIVRLYYKHAKDKITDYSFLEAIKKKYPDYGSMTFLDCENCIFVVVNNEDQLILRTVLKRDMMEGTIFKTFDGKELGDVFDRWKFEARQRR